ncbi:MAG: hypothetical protein NTU41_05030 [Chloroflexi bacterium]|nr:hypothetical protein [Chloroflexota bacterium]
MATEGLAQGEYMRLWIPACAGMTLRLALVYATEHWVYAFNVCRCPASDAHKHLVRFWGVRLSLNDQ